MEIRKSLTAIGAALMMVGISAPALAAGFDWDNELDCSDAGAVSQELIRLEQHLRCETKTDVSWPKDNPIWEKARSEERGCTEVHESHANKLYRSPPRNPGNTDKKGKGPGKVAEGAAQKVLEEKYDEAITMLMDLRDAVSKSTPNRAFVDAAGNVGAEGASVVSGALVTIINDDAIPCVNQLLQPQP
jgi:hypothetical protein